MRILALDTSSEFCSVALWRDGVASERSEQVGQKHSERLMDMLHTLLCDADVKLAQLDGIAFGMGPGSFTGVRIACGVTQGLALGADLPVVGICTLQALAEASGQARVIAALDARMNEIYLAVYEQVNGVWVTVVEPCLCKPEHTPAVSGEGWFGAGSGFIAHGAALQASYAEQLCGVDGSIVPQASAVAKLAAIQFALGLGVDAALATPLYLRDKVALKTHEREDARAAAG